MWPFRRQSDNSDKSHKISIASREAGGKGCLRLILILKWEPKGIIYFCSSRSPLPCQLYKRLPPSRKWKLKATCTRLRRPIPKLSMCPGTTRRLYTGHGGGPRIRRLHTTRFGREWLLEPGYSDSGGRYRWDLPGDGAGGPGIGTAGL